MVLKQLEILNYKNITEVSIEFSPNVNCFIGQNGQGKTNLLDAIYFLSFTKSATNHIDSMNIRHGEDMMMLKGIYNLNDTEETIQCGLKRGQAKQMRRNMKLYKKMSEHVGLLPIILVSPNDTELISGGSDERRRFLDLVISQYNKDYLERLVRYNKALQQRNTVLKQAEMTLKGNSTLVGNLSEMLDMYDEVLAEDGSLIYEERRKFIDIFIPLFQDYYKRISGGKETVGLKYVSHAEHGNLIDTLKESRPKDVVVGYSLHGIHKDELEMTLDGFGIKKEGSQGQNKTFLVALKLAQFNFLKNTGSQTTPLLLLDDIFDKLDADRVEQIITLTSDEHFGQIFITDTNREHIDKILQNTVNDFKLFNVVNGNIL